jgi:dipeptidyl aminopeptidase/acylaminoacyl peptidase
MIVGASADGAVWLVRSETPQNPGVYWGFDRTTRTMNRILDTVEELAGRKLAPTRVIDFTTRDGVQLWAYVTGHRSADGVPQPVVVMPHGGPEARDYYGYDPLVQLFAARGYLVVQPNFRGSEGFGLQFVRAGQGQWGKRMQDDVIDAFQALVKAGEADPERACIVGWSYGGYAALMGAARDPGLFQCVVSVAGVSDLIEMLRHDRALYTAERSSGFLYWRVSIGELGRDDDALAATSPARMADRITAPVLLIHGKVDDVVPPQQSEMMARVLRAAGKPHELLLIEGGDHTLFEIGMRKTAYARMDAFVARHLGGR